MSEPRNTRMRDRAEALEREAEATGDRELWAVAGDAWEEAGQDARAWYAFLRSRGYANRVVTAERAREIAHLIDTLPPPMSTAGSDHWNQLRNALKVYDFVTTQPARYFTYHDDNGRLGTFMGDPVGVILQKGRIVRPFGNGGRIQYVTVRAINGFDYRGTCAVENGNYCKLRRAAPWLIR